MVWNDPLSRLRLLLPVLLVLLAGCISPDRQADEVMTTPVAEADDRPTVTVGIAPPTRDTVAAAGGKLCPTIPRPALVTTAGREGAAELEVTALGGATGCTVALAAPSLGGVQSAGDSLFYLAGSGDHQVIRHLSPEGADLPLAFTQVAHTIGTINFRVAEDGNRIAWSATVNKGTAANPVMHAYLWAAKLDGSALVTLVETEVDLPVRQYHPLHLDDRTVTYAVTLQPGDGGWTARYGSYDQLYRVSLQDGEERLVFDCTEKALSDCIGDISPDGTLFAYTNPLVQAIHIHRMDGTPVGTIAPAPSDYIGAAHFTPSGAISFTTSRLTTASGITIPAPGMLYAVDPPYSDAAEPLLRGNGIGTIVRWVDGSHVVYRAVDSTGSAPVLASADSGQERRVPFPDAILP